MARPATGSIDERRGSTGRSWRLRFRAYGERQTVTLHERDGWTAARAADELDNILADVRRALWRPVEAPAAPEPPAAEATFYELARDWYEAQSSQLRPRTRVDYEWRLNAHLLPFFGDVAVSRIDVAMVDAYRQDRVRESEARRVALAVWEQTCATLRTGSGPPPRPPRALSASTINKTLILLGAILDLADERELIARNPLRVNPRRRKLATSSPRRRWLDSAEQIAALVAAATTLDAEARMGRGCFRRAVVSTLTFGGLRIGELCELRWRDVDLASGWIRLRGSKTAAGVRDIRLLPVLRDELATWKATSPHTAAADYVFATATGRRNSEDNIRDRIIAKAVERASERLTEAGRPPLPEGLTPHSLRHTFTSLLFVLGTELPEVMAQVGHSTPRMTMGVYAHVMRRERAERDALRALANGEELPAASGSPQQVAASMGPNGS